MLFVHICTCVLYSRLQLSGTTTSWKVKAMGQPQHFLFVSAAFPGRTPFRCGPGASSRGAELIRMALIDSVAFEGATATGYFYIRIEVLELDFDFACILHHPSLISIYDWSHEGMFFWKSEQKPRQHVEVVLELGSHGMNVQNVHFQHTVTCSNFWSLHSLQCTAQDVFENRCLP